MAEFSQRKTIVYSPEFLDKHGFATSSLQLTIVN